MPGLTSKVFRTWKASHILQDELNKHVPDVGDETHTKKLMYDRVNIEVAKALNHKKMGTNDARVQKLKDKVKEFKAKKKRSRTAKQKSAAQRSIDINQAKLEEAEYNISTSTSKVNYLDPRITVAWAKKGEVPIEKLYNKTQLKKFVWAMEATPDWEF
jgi:DNA topoisomerase-1